jgi:hypothetical protein
MVSQRFLSSTNKLRVAFRRIVPGWFGVSSECAVNTRKCSRRLRTETEVFTTMYLIPAEAKSHLTTQIKFI